MSMLISVVIVGAVIVVVTRMVTAEVYQPATGQAETSHRLRRAHALPPAPAAIAPEPEPEPRPLWVARTERVVPLRWWQRLRSGLVLLSLLAGLGLFAAAAIGLVAVAVVQAVRGAVG